MDDLIANLTSMLGSEEGMQNLKNMADSLGLDLDSVMQGAGASGEGEGASGDGSSNGGSGGGNASSGGGLGDLGIDMNTILMLQKLMASSQQDDKNAQLLRALKPHLSERRSERVDNAIRIMKLIEMFPLLRDSGVLGGLLG